MTLYRVEVQLPSGEWKGAAAGTGGMSHAGPFARELSAIGMPCPCDITPKPTHLFWMTSFAWRQMEDFIPTFKRHHCDLPVRVLTMEEPEDVLFRDDWQVVTEVYTEQVYISA